MQPGRRVPHVEMRLFQVDLREASLQSDATHVRFSNRPFGVKRFQTIHHYSVDVAHGLLLLGNACGQEMPIMSLISIV